MPSAQPLTGRVRASFSHAFGFRLRANAPKGQKRFPISRMKKMPAITFLSVLAILFFGFELCPAQAEEPGLLVLV